MVTTLRTDLTPVLPRASWVQIAYRIVLLDDAIVRSNTPDEVMQRTLVGEKKSRFLFPWQKLKHQQRELMERLQRLQDYLPSVVLNCSTKCYCNRCVSCFINGSLGSVGENRVSYSLRSQSKGTWALSEAYADEIREYTLNAIDPLTQSPGSAFTSMSTVPAGTRFYGDLLLSDPTEDMVAYLLYTLKNISHAGASTSKLGRCQIEILSVVSGRFVDATWAPALVVPQGEAAIAAIRAKNDPALMALADESDEQMDARMRRLYGQVQNYLSIVSQSDKKREEANGRFERIFADYESEKVDAFKSFSELLKATKDIKATLSEEALELLASGAALLKPKKDDGKSEAERAEEMAAVIEGLREALTVEV